MDFVNVHIPSINMETKSPINPANNVLPGTTLTRRARTTTRRSQTFSQIFDQTPPVELLQTPPVVTAVFTSSNAVANTKSSLNRQLSTPSSNYSSLSLSYRKETLPPGQTRGFLKAPGFICPGLSFRDIHTCITVEHKFQLTRPLAMNGRYLLKEGSLDLLQNDQHINIYVYLFNDCLVFGEKLNNALFNQVHLPFSSLTIDTKNLGEDFKFVIEDHFQEWVFEATNLDCRDSWVSVIQSGITFHRCMSERKAKEESLAQSYSRSPGSYADTFHVRDRIKNNRRGSFYETLKTWGDSLSRRSSVNSLKSNADTSNWVPDNQVSVCMVCQVTKFGMIVRKHHCRSCGMVICWKCSVVQPAQPEQSPCRVCIPCANQYSKQSPCLAPQDDIAEDSIKSSDSNSSLPTLLHSEPTTDSSPIKTDAINSLCVNFENQSLGSSYNSNVTSFTELWEHTTSINKK